ncbi:MAG: diphthamide biosynthesis enzyme Dph2 [Candidatus Bathyarchaeota archaeon]|nr:MAG: diphthamide biosynthesis enzyme Dph2 [Candidatus Bathyarchaeota archaeon]
MERFDFEEERLKQEIGKLEARRVLIQLPEGLKLHGPRLASIVEKAGALPIVSADPCYGACDLVTAEAESLGVDLIVHYGHAKLSEYECIPTIYVEARATVEVSDAVEKALPLLKNWHKVGLATTVQHIQTLNRIKEILLNAGKTVIIGDAEHSSYPGQVIGCNYSNVKSIARNVEAFLFVGGGRFHALGVALSTSKPTIVADPYENRAFSVDDEAKILLKKRWASICDAKEAERLAILIGLKNGQQRLRAAMNLKVKLKKLGRRATLLAITEITPIALMQFPDIDAFINTACPRISLDDSKNFPKPVITLNEAYAMLNEITWEELCRRGWFES